MREDMFDVVCGGRGSRNKNIGLIKERRQTKRECKKAIDDDKEVICPKKASLTHGIDKWSDTRHRRDNTSVIDGWLKQQVGRPWNDVYSELAAFHKKTRAKLGVTLVEYYGLVETKTVMCNGVVCHRTYDHALRPVEEYWRTSMYVHPVTGLLCKSPDPRSHKEKKHKPEVVRYVDKNKPLVQFHKTNGLWYEVILREPTYQEKALGYFVDHVGKLFHEYTTLTPEARASKAAEREAQFVYILHNHPIIKSIAGDRFQSRSLYTWCKELFGGMYLPIKRRQLNKREIKQLKKKLSAT